MGLSDCTAGGATRAHLPLMALVAVAVALSGAQPALTRLQLEEREGRYCSARTGEKCCLGRRDECTAPIRDHLCYCDYWCDQHVHVDCCPDFQRTCRGAAEPVTPEPAAPSSCTHDGATFEQGSEIKKNCNLCRCSQDGQWECDNEACIDEQWLVDSINSKSSQFGWQATTYASFRGITLKDGVRWFLGTRKPSQQAAEMHPILLDPQLLHENYDQRQRKLDFATAHVQPPRDQGRCGSDWAFAAADMLADRLSIDTNGAFKDALSIQDIISCGSTTINSWSGCQGGNVEDAFFILKENGALPERCYSYESGQTSETEQCRSPALSDSCTRHKSQPAYRVSTNELEIRKEIFVYGTVLAIMEVRPDFYLYKQGVYTHTGLAEAETSHDHRKNGYHAVRIIGWGTDQGTPYWLAINSWGRHWGEHGFFRIRRGTNESGIESFVIAVWSPMRTDTAALPTKKRRRKRV